MLAMEVVSKAFGKLRLSRSASLPYSRLPSPQHTRLLERVPDKTRLTYRLFTIDISSIQPNELVYDALSYTWGAPLASPECERSYSAKHDVPIVIVIDGARHEYRVNRNLAEALEHIDNWLPVWVDAVCINQADLEEKSQQILLMCEIYSRAARVLAWAGLGDEHTKHLEWLANTAFPDLDGRFGDGPIPTHLFADTAEGGIRIIGETDYVLPREAMTAMYGLTARRRNFSRAWVLQELALARAPFLVLGKTMIGLNGLARLERLLHDMGGLIDTYRPLDALGRMFPGANLSEYYIIARQIRGWETKMKPDLQKAYGAHDGLSSALAFVVDLITQTEVRYATDPRDLIYSLSGIARRVESVDVIIPDYTTGVDEVFTAFTALVLKTLPSRGILGSVGIKKPHADYVVLLPSWVPDLATCFGCMTSRSIIFNSTGEIPEANAGKAPLRIQGRRLSLRARRCGVIMTTFQARKARLQEVAEVYLEDVRWISGILKQCDDSNLEATLRVLCYGASMHGDAMFEILWRKFLIMCVIEVPTVVDDFDPKEVLELFSRFDSPLVPDDIDIFLEEKWIEFLTTVPPEERTLKEIQMLWPHIKTEDDYEDFLLPEHSVLIPSSPKTPLTSGQLRIQVVS